MSKNVTVSLFVAASPEAIWNFTQDYIRRMEWDDSILEAEVLQEPPELKVKTRGRDGLRFVNQYTLYHRPEQTSVSMEEVRPSWNSGGGGSLVVQG